MNAAQIQLATLAGRLGRTGVIAIGLGVFVLMFYMTSLAPARARLDDARARLVQLQRKAPDATVALRHGSDNPFMRVQRFYGSFPGAENLAPAVHDTQAVAARHGLMIEQAEYQLLRESNDALAAYEMTFALKGPYPKVRDFLIEILRQHPEVVVDDIGFRRETASSYGVDAKVRLTFFVRSKPWTFGDTGAG